MKSPHRNIRYGLTVKPPLMGKWQRVIATSTLPGSRVRFWLRNG